MPVRRANSPRDIAVSNLPTLIFPLEPVATTGGTDDVMSQFYAYRELRDNLVALILDGHIAEGEALPSVRSLANSHGVNPLTVAKALYNLPAGTLRSVRGVGNFVAKGAVERLRVVERAIFFEERWPQIEAEIVRLRLTRSELFSVLPQAPAEGTGRGRSEAGARCA